jgi:excisionase family DNA binding protein
MADELTTQEAAALLGLTARRVRQLCEAGELPARKIGGQRGLWLIPRSAVLARLKGATDDSAAPEAGPANRQQSPR